MFELQKDSYMTGTVKTELSQEHQLFILNYITRFHKQMTDYFQIFEFFVQGDHQWLLHRQEEPEIETLVKVDLQEALPISQKVWAMDEQDHIIILLPEDY
ncbi:DUF960 family protein [Bacillus sp. Au-Bac7]|uniref:DUF960 family protein n=1 Tax=Bacillus sp. Au-Bac7 TaxID=2906458 RepID=UPI001E493573|nr:DUF960 family protein [Bacillus sp. Au-Bac7]MCE4049918.1 DUF960 domain-containing protein [Bacillus sp. Au-Bac7]